MEKGLYLCTPSGKNADYKFLQSFNSQFSSQKSLRKDLAEWGRKLTFAPRFEGCGYRADEVSGLRPRAGFKSRASTKKIFEIRKQQ